MNIAGGGPRALFFALLFALSFVVSSRRPALPSESGRWSARNFPRTGALAPHENGGASEPGDRDESDRGERRAVVRFSRGVQGSLESGPGATLTTGDTSLRVEARGNRIVLTSLRCVQTGWDWIDGPNRAGADFAALPLMASAQMAGRTVSLRWRFADSRVLEGLPRRFVMTFACDNPALELQSYWQAGSGPILHRLTIRNRGEQPVILAAQPSLAFVMRGPVAHALEWTWLARANGRGGETELRQERVTPGYAAARQSGPGEMESERGTKAEPSALPWLTVQDMTGAQGWYAGVLSSGPVKIALRPFANDPASGAIAKETNEKTEKSEKDGRYPMGSGGAAPTGSATLVEIGVPPEPPTRSPCRTRLAPGETFAAPPVFVGCYAGDLDTGANALRRWIATDGPGENPTPRPPRLAYLAPGDDAKENDGAVRHQLEASAALGLERFELGAGWERALGDWRPDPARFPDGLAPLADDARARSLQFGLHLAWTQGGDARPGRARGPANPPDAPTLLSVRDPLQREWFTQDYPPNWKPSDARSATVCLADPRAVTWGAQRLAALARDTHCSLLADDGRSVITACERTDHAHTDSPTDIALQSARGYADLLDALHARNPGLQIARGAGANALPDYGLLTRVAFARLTPDTNGLANRRALYAAAYALPPAACQCVIDPAPTEKTTTPEFVARLRSGLMAGFTLVGKPDTWREEWRDAAWREFARYKTALRPLIAAGDLYHVGGWPDGVHWDGLQYEDAPAGAGALFAFRGSEKETRHVFKWRGLSSGARYQARFADGTSETVTRTGDDLMQNGLAITLPDPQTSEIVLLQRLADGARR